MIQYDSTEKDFFTYKASMLGLDKEREIRMTFYVKGRVISHVTSHLIVHNSMHTYLLVLLLQKN